MDNLEWIRNGGDFLGWLREEHANAPRSHGGPISGPETAGPEPEPAKDGNGAEDAPKCAKPVESDGDTREKLEAEIAHWAYMFHHGDDRIFTGWLDRQAAITERESHHRIEDLSRDCEMWRDRSEDMRMERDELESTANTLRASVAGLKASVERQAGTIAAQRDELARFNAEKRGKRRLPKHVAWPRHDDGKLVKLAGNDALTVSFSREGCLVRYADGSDEYLGMDELRRRWKEVR